MLEPWILKKSKTMKTIIGALYQKKLISESSSIHALTENEKIDIENYSKSGKTVVIPNFTCKIKIPTKKPTWFTEKYLSKTIFLYLESNIKFISKRKASKLISKLFVLFYKIILICH